MKYRLLTQSELEELREDFVKFLVVNGIPADEWTQWQQSEVDKANRVVQLFSDVVFEKILADVQYLRFVDEKEMKTFHCKEKEITLVGIKIPNNHRIDLTKDEFSSLLNLPSGEVATFTQTKHYKSSREQELFQLIEAGASISDGYFYKQLCLLL